MKKKSFNKKLVLSKQIISNLNDHKMDNIKGGRQTDLIGTGCCNSEMLSLCNLCYPTGLTDCQQC